MPVFFADTAPAAVSASDWSSVISAMTSQISVATVVGVLLSKLLRSVATVK